MRKILLPLLFISSFALGFCVLVIVPKPHALPLVSACDDTELPLQLCAEVPRADTLLFGFSTHGLGWCKDEIGEGQNFAQLLRNLQIPLSRVFALAAQTDTIWDVRGMRAGRNYYVIHDSLNEKNLHYFILDVSAEQYLVCDLRGPEVRVWLHRRRVELVERAVACVVQNSLWQTLQQAGADPSLAVSMSEIFAWSVDFFHLRPGDAFKVIFREKQIDGVPAGAEDIRVAEFRHRNQTFYAFSFEQDGMISYYDETGDALRNSMLITPLKYTRISSGFSQKRFHPILKVYRPHPAIDFAAPEGTPVHATGDGVISEAQFKSGNGNYIKIRHDDTYSTQYLHLSGFATGIRAGTPVKQGQVIGYVGQTGLATGPHLCYRLWKNGEQLDPFLEKKSEKVPVRPEHLHEFLGMRDGWIRSLASVTMDPECPPVQDVEMFPGSWTDSVEFAHE